MTEKILVTYASRTGTTGGVADVIGKTLSDSGKYVDVLTMNDVKEGFFSGKLDIINLFTYKSIN